MPQILNFASFVLAEALADLSAGVRETLPNSGPAIAAYAAPFGLKPPLNWCALAVSAWVRRAAQKAGIVSPVVGSPAAQGVMGQLLHAALWTPADVFRQDPEVGDLIFCPGNIIVWRRGAPGSWMGHIGLVEYYPHKDALTGKPGIATVEGNSGPKGDRVSRMVRSFKDANWLGIGRLDMVAVPVHQVNDPEPHCKKDPLA